MNGSKWDDPASFWDHHWHPRRRHSGLRQRCGRHRRRRGRGGESERVGGALRRDADVAGAGGPSSTGGLGWEQNTSNVLKIIIYGEIGDGLLLFYPHSMGFKWI